MLKNPLLIAMVAGVIALGTVVFVTDAPAYAGTAPETCPNCHVMDSMYENYYHSAPKPWAVCADCHLPHDNLAHYYVEKGRQGNSDVYVFSTGQVPDVIPAQPRIKDIIQENCIHCHADTVETIVMGTQPFDRYCWECHRSIAH